MKAYIKNKNFIPLDFINEMNFKANKNNNKLIVILFIINMFTIPTSVSNIKNNIKSKETIQVSKINIEEKDLNKEKIIKVINIINKNIKSIDIQNSFGVIEFNDIEEVFNLEKEEKIKVNTLKINSMDSLLAEVEIWLKKGFYI